MSAPRLRGSIGLDQSSPSKAYVSCALFLLFCVNTLSYFDRTLLAVVLNDVKLEFELSDTEAGLLSGLAFALFYGLLGIPMAWAADRWNRVKLIAGSVLTWSLATSATGLTQSGLHLLLARALVGAGEAGGAPPSHSLVGDYVPPARRSMALAFITMGSSVGVAFGYGYAGLVNEWFGWRTVFLWAGLPGVLLALILLSSLREPQRGRHDPGGVASAAASIPFATGVARLFSSPTYAYIVIALSLTFVLINGLAAWLPTFFVRTHEMATGQIGLWLMITGGAAQVAGLWLGGVIGNLVLSRGWDPRWALWTPAIGMAIALPLLIVALWSDDPITAMILMMGPSLLNLLYVGPVFAMVQQIAGARLRGLASAIIILAGSLIGSGLGPLFIGMLSDAMTPSFGADALKFSMMAAGSVYLVIVFFLCVAAAASRGDKAMQGIER